jgi:hypothetical protein
MTTTNLKVLRYAFSNRTVTLYPFGTSFEPTYPSLGVNLPTGKGADIDIFAETIQIHAGSKFELFERTVSIHARRLVILDAISAGAPTDKVIFDLSGRNGDEYTTAASNGSDGRDGWVREDNHIVYVSYENSHALVGAPGGGGSKGNSGKTGGSIVLMAEISCPPSVTLEINCRGGNGGKGQAGGNGGRGGNGARPGDCSFSVEDAGCQYAIDGSQCGNGGMGGQGGQAGEGGQVTFHHHGSPKDITLNDILPPSWKTMGDIPTSTWGDKVDKLVEVKTNFDIAAGTPGEGGTGGEGGNHGRWEHRVFINTTRG